MKQRRTPKLLSMIMALLMIVTCLVSPAMATGTALQDAEPQTLGETAGLKSNGFDTKLTADEEVIIMVKLEGETTYVQTGDLQLASAGYDSQMTAMARAESRVASTLGQAIDVENRYSLLFNGFSFTGQRWMIDAINEMPGVTAFEAPMFELIEAEAVEGDVDLTPSMGTSTGLVGATNAWDLGYTGEGMVVAVLDTGIHQQHEAFAVNPENGKIDRAYLENVYKTYGDKMHGGSAADLDAIYYSAKMPFNWDYFDGDAIPNHTASTHGSHVAGIVAGNNGTTFKGVAPDAQIVTMQVFRSDGGASFDTIMQALEDCVYLGVDAINMSLGVTAYFTAYETISPEMEGIYNALEEAGISVCAAAGNDANSNYETNVSYGYGSSWFSWNVDAGTIGAPATFAGSFSVASVANGSGEGCGWITAYGKEYYPMGVNGVLNLNDLESGNYGVVYVGEGSVEEIAAAGGVAGKIALVRRGTLDFNQKAQYAAEAGAVAIILFNNVSGLFNPSLTSTIPFGALSLEAAEALMENFVDGAGVLTVNHGLAYKSVPMALSSSWGTTADLQIKPEIAAPGDNINSVMGYTFSTNTYGLMSGTSMATPHVAGGMLLVKQRLREAFPDKTAVEINELAHAFLMSTAHQTASDVRRAGAGLMDLESAVTTEAYLSVPGVKRPKLELGDNEDGCFTFTFEVVNFGKQTKTYDIVPSVLIDVATEMVYSGYGESGDYADEFKIYNQWNDLLLSNPTPTTVKVISGSTQDVTEMCEITAPESVTVQAGETKTITMTILANKSLMAYIEENFASGTFLEGYIALQDRNENGNDLSIPFLGFVGNWNYVPMFDQGFWWNIPYGVNNMAQMPTSQGTYVGSGVLDNGLGLNYYWDEAGETYVADRNAISPNGDGFMDTADYIEFSLMRTPKTVKLSVQDAQGKELAVFSEATYNFRKEYYNTGSPTHVSYSSMSFDLTGLEMQENETVYLVLEAWLDREGFDITENQNGRMVFPITKDTIAPAVKAVEDGIRIQDANYIAYYGVYADVQRTELVYETGVFAEKRGMAEVFNTELDTYFVSVADYARNEAFYMVKDGQVYAVEADGFGHTGKTMVGRQFANWNTLAREYAWYTFNTETPNAPVRQTEIITQENNSYVNELGTDFTSGVMTDDGTPYVCTKTALYTLDLDTYEVTEVAPFTSADSAAPAVRALTKNPETGKIYAWVDLAYMSSYLCELNVETGELTTIWALPSSLGFFGMLFNLGTCFIDGDTVVIWSDHYGHKLWLVDFATGEVNETIELGFITPDQANLETLLGAGAMGGAHSLVFDEAENCLYMFAELSNAGLFRFNSSVMLQYDFDTAKAEISYIGSGAGSSMYGLFFLEEEETDECIYYNEVIAPTCTEDGYTIHTCMDCGQQYKDSIVPAYCPAGEFSDLNTTKWYHEGVCYAIRNGLMNGMGNGTFAPEANMTRAQLVTVLYRLAGSPIVGGLDNPFRDVAANQWYADAVIWAADRGIINGIDETTFAPNANITREQLVTILYRFYDEPAADAAVLAAYTDKAAISEYAVSAMAWAVDNGIVNGMTETTLVPRGSATRAQIATILMRLLQD